MAHDWDEWRHAYDDPESALSWRLRTVRAHIDGFLDDRPGSVHVVSVCAGDGRDVLGVLSERADADRVEVTLVELHPNLAAAARERAAALPGVRVDVRETDACTSDAYLDLAPADLLLLCGIFGNISATDIATTIDRARGLCAPDALVVWTRGRGHDHEDLDAEVRGWFADAGYDEVAHDTLERAHRPTVGVHRHRRPAPVLRPGERLFTFLR